MADLIHVQGPATGLYEDRISHEATSYCWGEPSFTEQIIANDLEHWITVSLAGALRQSRFSNNPRWHVSSEALESALSEASSEAVTQRRWDTARHDDVNEDLMSRSSRLRRMPSSSCASETPSEASSQPSSGFSEDDRLQRRSNDLTMTKMLAVSGWLTIHSHESLIGRHTAAFSIEASSRQHLLDVPR